MLKVEAHFWIACNGEEWWLVADAEPHNLIGRWPVSTIIPPSNLIGQN